MILAQLDKMILAQLDKMILAHLQPKSDRPFWHDGFGQLRVDRP